MCKVYDIRGDSHMYLTLLDKKRGLPVIFCSKRSKDNGRGGKFTKSRYTPPRPLAIVLTQYGSGMHLSQMWSSVPELHEAFSFDVKRSDRVSRGRTG